jgi:hypothetical protein
MKLSNATGTPYKELVTYFYDNYKNLEWIQKKI